MIKLILFLLNILYIFAKPNDQCPVQMIESGLTTDLIVLADQISNEARDISGLCGQYKPVKTCNGIYDTRMRIYDRNGSYFIVFRPTQQNPTAEEIHIDRRLVPTSFLTRDNRGRVHNRFQQAFINLYEECKDIIDTFNNQTPIYITGHSLGGSFSLFMSAKLYYDHNLIAKKMYGFAGTFIGNKEYTESVQNLMRDQIDMRIVETVNKNDWDQFDGTSEYYNTLDNTMYIDNNLICGFYIEPLRNSYGMHDLKNYYSLVRENRIC